MRKICVVTAHKDPDYVRARTLRSAVEQMDDTELIVVKNKNKSLLRFIEVAFRLVKTRITERPDVYILTFRGYEFLPIAWLITLGKPLVFDELVNFIEWIAYEHKKVKPHSIAYEVLWMYYRMITAMPKVILADTDSHGQYSAKLMKLPAEKFVTVPVATDESLFYPRPAKKSEGTLKVFYIGSMLPLHGIQYALDAAVALKDQPIEFLFVGGKEKTAKLADEAAQKGARVEYRKWIPFEDIPEVIASSDLCLAGPYGGTLQAGMVITGKTYQFMAIGKASVIGKIELTTPFADKQNCILVDQASVDSLVEAFMWALNNTEKLPVIGAAARKTYEDEMSVARVREVLEHDVLPRL